MQHSAVTAELYKQGPKCAVALCSNLWKCLKSSYWWDFKALLWPNNVAVLAGSYSLLAGAESVPAYSNLEPKQTICAAECYLWPSSARLTITKMLFALASLIVLLLYNNVHSLPGMK